MRKWIIAAGSAAALGGAGVGAAILNVPGLAAAQTATSQAPANGSQSAPDPNTPPPWMTDALKKLVDAGTINQSQSDAVTQALLAARPPGGPGGPGGHHGPGGPGGPGRGLDSAASAIGIDAATLKSELQSGKTIAQVAQEHGVDVQKVVDAMVADLKTHLDADVTAGRTTQAQEDSILADAPQHISDHVNGKAPAGPPGGPGARGFGGPGAPGAPGGGSTTPTTTG